MHVNQDDRAIEPVEVGAGTNAQSMTHAAMYPTPAAYLIHTTSLTTSVYPLLVSTPHETFTPTAYIHIVHRNQGPTSSHVIVDVSGPPGVRVLMKAHHQDAQVSRSYQLSLSIYRQPRSTIGEPDTTLLGRLACLHPSTTV